MAEFSIIEAFCQGIGPNHAETRLSVGDDAAVVMVPPQMELVVSVDTMVENVHFLPDVSPENLAYKIMAVNLSDMAAMGAQPKWATLALTLPSIDSAWLRLFSDSLKRTADAYQVQIIGGDTTQGGLSLTLNIMGLSPKGNVLSRAGALPGDDVYVSGVLGDAALGLDCLTGGLCTESSNLNEYDEAQLVAALERPKPRVGLGQALLGHASACLDVSDGLIGDLSHICQQSDVSVSIDLASLPLSTVYRKYLKQGGDLAAALSGGDDYELAFTAPKAQRSHIQDIAQKHNCLLSRIGRVSEFDGQAVHLLDGSPSGQCHSVGNLSSYQHFT